MYHGVCHIEPFCDGHDRTSFETVFCRAHQQHGDCLQALIIFSNPFFMVVTFEQMTIKHSMYMQKVPFLCTERACVVFSGFGIHPRRKVTWSKVLQVLWTRGSSIYHMSII